MRPRRDTVYAVYYAISSPDTDPPLRHDTGRALWGFVGIQQPVVGSLPFSSVKALHRNRAVLANLQATCSTRVFRTVPPQELTDAAHKAARLIDTDAHIQTASRSYTRALWYQSRVWDPDD